MCVFHKGIPALFAVILGLCAIDHAEAKVCFLPNGDCGDEETEARSWEVLSWEAVSVPAAAIFQSILPNNAKMKVLNWSIAAKSKSNTAFVPMTTVMRKAANAETT